MVVCSDSPAKSVAHIIYQESLSQPIVAVLQRSERNVAQEIIGRIEQRSFPGCFQHTLYGLDQNLVQRSRGFFCVGLWVLQARAQLRHGALKLSTVPQRQVIFSPI